MVDTGAAVSLFPVSLEPSTSQGSPSEFVAVNSTPINTYGTKDITIISGDQNQLLLPWKFLLADVNMPVLGADFMTYYKLIVDFANKRVIHSESGIPLNSICASYHVLNAVIYQSSNPCVRLLTRFPELLGDYTPYSKSPHGVIHTIETTSDEPICFRKRNFNPEKEKASEQTFMNLRVKV